VGQIAEVLDRMDQLKAAATGDEVTWSTSRWSKAPHVVTMAS